MRSNIPSFRLPESVLDEEIDDDPRHGGRDSLQHAGRQHEGAARRAATTLSSWAPARRKAKTSTSPAATSKANIHIGIDWLESVAFGHIDKIGEHVLIIGVGNTAMDCCRTSRRLGGKDIKVMARRPRGYFKASPWELEDAEEEKVEIVINHAPKEFVLENGKLVGMVFEKLEWNETTRQADVDRDRHRHLPCDDVILAIGQENAFPWIERDIGIEFDKWGMPLVDKKTMQSTRPGVFFGGDAALGPEEHHLGGRARTRGRHLHPQPLPGRRPHRAARPGDEPHQPEDGHPASGATATTTTRPRAEDDSTSISSSGSKQLNIEVELGFTAEQTANEVQRCLNCDMQTVFTDRLCIECDACVDVCPLQCLTITPNAEEPELRHAAVGSRRRIPEQDLFVSGPLPQTSAHHGQRRRSLRALRSLRGALPHGRLGHAEVRTSYPLAGQLTVLQPAKVDAETISRSSSPTSTEPARPAPMACSCRPSFAWGSRSRVRTFSPPTSRACPPGTRFGSTRTATPPARSNST